MSDELLEVSETAGWTKKQNFEFERLSLMVERIEAEKCDITMHLNGSLWARIGCAMAIFGEKARELFHRVSCICEEYDQEKTNKKYDWCLQNSRTKTLNGFDRICRENKIDITIGDAEGMYPMDFVPEDSDPGGTDSVKDYGFFSMKNRYYKMVKTEKGWKHTDFTNFTLNIKYHIYDRQNPKRIIELHNVHGRVLTVDAPTDIFTSINNFKKFIEGLGNFLFDGSAVDLMRIKRKLFAEERECHLIDILGWQKDGFYAFSNGIYHDGKFIPCDDDGIVDTKKCMYYIPAGNKLYSTMDEELTNQKNFRHFPDHPATLEDWSRQMVEVFGSNGMVAVLFGVSCLMSDVIFSTMHGFPMMFLYGEGSTGKGKLMSSVQHLCGMPQTPLKISEKANTDKAKIREMAQFRNGISGLEEYTNSIDDKALNTLKGIWDRLGYKRAIMDSRYGNESVPINSGVFVTGNEYPADDPLLQRMVVLEINKNKFTEEEKDRFNRLMAYQEAGITNITCRLMDLRKDFEKTYRKTFQDEYNVFSRELSLINLTDRMVNNVTILLATYKLLDKAGVKLPFSYSDVSIYLKDICEKQANKRNMGAPVQQFWDCVLQLANQRVIRHEREFKIQDEYLVINYNLIFPHYAKELSMQRRTPQSKSSLLDKLKLSPAYLGWESCFRYNGERRTSGFKFKYKLVDVDLLYVVAVHEDEEAKRRQEARDRTQAHMRNGAGGGPDAFIEGARQEQGELALANVAEEEEDRPF